MMILNYRPLHEAAENGATELVRLLLSYGADPLLATYSGQTPLMLAVDTDAYTIIEQHLNDVQGRPNIPWSFGGPSSIFGTLKKCILVTTATLKNNIETKKGVQLIILLT